MPNPTPDTRATVELCERLDAELTNRPFAMAGCGEHNHGPESLCWRLRDAKGKRTESQLPAMAEVCNALPIIIRDLRRLVEVEADTGKQVVGVHYNPNPEGRT